MREIKKISSIVFIMFLIMKLGITNITAEETDTVPVTGEDVSEQTLEEPTNDVEESAVFDVEKFEAFLEARGYQFYPLETISFNAFCSTSNLENVEVEVTYGEAGVYNADFNNFENYEIPEYIHNALHNPNATLAQIDEAIIALDQIIISQFVTIDNDTSILFYTPSEVEMKISYLENGQRMIKKYTVTIVSDFIEATGLKFVRDDFSMDIDTNETLALELYPAFSVPTDRTLSFGIEYSDNLDIELVDLTNEFDFDMLQKGIKVTGVKAGIGTITVKDKSGKLEPAVITITVKGPASVNMDETAVISPIAPTSSTDMQSSVLTPSTGDLGHKKIYFSIMIVAFVVGGNLIYIKRRKTVVNEYDI